METTAAPTQTAVEIEVEVKRIERYACGCTSTRISARTIEDKYRLICAAHGQGLASVETSMQYRPVKPEPEAD